MGVSKNWAVYPPKSSILIEFFPYKPSILFFFSPYFWEIYHINHCEWVDPPSSLAAVFFVGGVS